MAETGSRHHLTLGIKINNSDSLKHDPLKQKRKPDPSTVETARVSTSYFAARPNCFISFTQADFSDSEAATTEPNKLTALG